MARTWCSEITLQDLTLLASSRNAKINRASLVFHGRVCCQTWTLSNVWDKLCWRVWNLEPAISKPLWILLDSTAEVGQDFMSWTHIPSEFNDENVIRQCEGYTQHKPEVVDCWEPFRDFLCQILKVYVPKRYFLRNYNYHVLIVKVLLTLGLHAVFIEFCKIHG